MPDNPFLDALNPAPVEPAADNPFLAALDPGRTRAGGVVRESLAARVPWQAVEPELRGLGVDPEEHRQQYQLAEARAVQQGEGIGMGEAFLRNSVPFGSSIRRYREAKAFSEAKQRFEAGQATEEDAGRIARFERLQQLEGQMGQSLGGALVQAAGKAPAILGEAAVGGAATKAIGAGLGIGAGAGAGLGARVGTFVGRQAAATPFMPSMYLDQMVQKNLSEGRAADDWRGLPPAVGLGIANNVVLGTVTRQFGGFSGNLATRVAKSGAAGVLEQQAVDAIAGAVDEILPKGWRTDTRGGAIGELLRGETDKALKAAAVQAVTFAAFAAAHDTGPKRRFDAKQFLAEFTQAVDTLRKDGNAAPAEAAAVIQPALQNWEKRVRSAPNPGDLDLSLFPTAKDFDVSKPPASPVGEKDLANLARKEAGQKAILLGQLDRLRNGQAPDPSAYIRTPPAETQTAERARSVMRELGINPTGTTEQLAARLKATAPGIDLHEVFGVGPEPAAKSTEPARPAPEPAKPAETPPEPVAAPERNAAAEPAVSEKPTEAEPVRIYAPGDEGKTESHPHVEPLKPTSPAMEDLIHRAERGEAIDPREVYDRAGLTERERHVVEQRMRMRTHEDIGGDAELGKRGGGRLTKQRVKQIEQEALEKLGLDKSIDLAVNEHERLDRALHHRERAGLVAPTELGHDPNVVRQQADKVQKRLDSYEAELTRVVDAVHKGLADGTITEELANQGLQYVGELHKAAQGGPPPKTPNPFEKGGAKSSPKNRRQPAQPAPVRGEAEGVRRGEPAARADGADEATAGRPGEPSQGDAAVRAGEPGGANGERGAAGGEPPAARVETHAGEDLARDINDRAIDPGDLPRGMGARSPLSADPAGPSFRERIVDSVRSTLAPATRGEAAGIGAGVFREGLARMARKVEIAKEALKGAEKYFDTAIGGQESVIERTKKFLEFTDAFEGGRIDTLPAEIRPFAETMRKLIDERTDAVRDRGLVKTFIENYMGHLWQTGGTHADPQTAGALLAARRPLAGSEAFRKKRTLPTWRDGIEAGLVPVDWNPARLAVLKLQQADKAVMAHDVIAELKGQGLWKFTKLSDRPPEGWTRIEDKAATVFAPPPEVKPIGPQLAGHYYTPEPVAKILNNYLQPGLRGNAVFDTFRGAGNVLNQFQLGFSAFHAAFVAMDTQVSALALGLQQLSRGQIGPGLRNVAGGVVLGLAPYRAWVAGSKVLKEYYAPGSQGQETAAIVDRLIQAGGRAKMDDFYGQGHFESFARALREYRGGNPEAKRAMILHALPGLAEAVSKPIMEVLVPRMKLGVFADMARAELAAAPHLDANGSRAVLGKAWDSVENRLGQLTYDNLFWHRTFKDMLMASVRSVGWNVGTWRELGGGVRDIPAAVKGLRTGAGVGPRAAYLVAMPAVAAMYGAMYQYLATGSGPQEFKDYFFPKTGRGDERVSLPSYMRDVAAFFNRADEGPMRLAGNAYHMMKSKANPVLGLTASMLENSDYQGTAVYNPNDPQVKIAADVAKEILAAFVSFSAREFLDRGKNQKGQGPLGLVGVTTAPAYIRKSWSQQRREEADRRVTVSPLQRKAMRDAGR